MATFREPDALAAFLMRAQARVVECIGHFANGDGAARITEARRVLRALEAAEKQILYPAFARVSLRPETHHLLDDSRDDRAQHLAALDVLAHKRAARLRKLSAVALTDVLQQHAERHITLLLPVLASQLPRAFYRSIVQAFATHYEGALESPSARTRPAEPDVAAAS